MKEIWKDIPKYEGLYQASNLGRIKSFDRNVKTTNQYGSINLRTIKGKVLKSSGSKYLKVALFKNNEKKYMTRLDVKSFMKPLSLEDTNKNSSIVADNIADFNASFNDSKSLEKSNDDEIPNGTVSYSITAFREVEKSSRAIDEVAKKKLIKEYDKAKKHKKTEKPEDESMKKNRYSIQINQSIVPFNNGKIN